MKGSKSFRTHEELVRFVSENDVEITQMFHVDYFEYSRDRGKYLRWHISYESKKIKTCPTCKGKGVVKIKNKKER